MLLKNRPRVSSALLASLERPEFCDLKIEVSDGEIVANKTVLSMTCDYFHLLFNNNLMDSPTGHARVKLPFPKAVVEKGIVYLYSGQMDCSDLNLGSLLDMLEFLSLLNLTEEFEQVESFTVKKIQKSKFSYLECLKNINKCSLSLIRMGSIEEKLLIYLGLHLRKLCEREEVGLLSQTNLIRLIQQKTKFARLTTARFKTFLTWLSVNSMEADRKAEILEMFDFNHFSVQDLASDVRNSCLYPCDKIIKRMEKLFKEQQERLILNGWRMNYLEKKSEEKDEILEEKETELEQLKEKLKTKNRELSLKDQEINQLKKENMFIEETLNRKRKNEEPMSKGKTVKFHIIPNTK